MRTGLGPQRGRPITGSIDFSIGPQPAQSPHGSQKVRIHAAPHRTAPRSGGCDSDFLALLHGAASQQSLGNAGNGPIVFGAGVLLGLLAWSSGSLIPGMIGHIMMDIGLFAYWWTGIDFRRSEDSNSVPARWTQPLIVFNG